ncbi:MAG: cytochrome c3 family protein, partial [Desulfobulbaceae bacterium]|nr:cytochrome c3 family protein [Desulfobulbaceae bacterium]
MKKITITGIQALACVTLAFLLATCVPTQPTPPKAVRNTCIDCHKEMAARYMQGNMHAPVREKNCEACHQPHGLIGGLFLRANQPDLCVSCHRGLRVVTDKKSIHKPLASGKCSVCHNPHNSQHPKLLADSADASCFSCHDRAPFFKTNIHAPLKQGGCKTCHDPHMADQPNLLIKDAD